MPLNLRQMEVFRAVMRTGSITAAARMLNVSQPSVSEILRYAEDRCGFQLFEREKGRLRPTHYADKLIDGVERVFEQVDKVNGTVEELKAERNDVLNIGCTYSLSISLVPKILSDFDLRHPKISPRIIVERRAESVAKINSGLLDGAISFLSDRYSEMEFHTIAEKPLHLICARSHPLAQSDRVSVRDLKDERFIGYLPYLLLQKRIDALFGQHGLSVRPTLEVEQIAQAWQLVQSGRGISIVDSFCNFQVFFPDVVTVEIVGAPKISLELLVKKGKPQSPALKLLIQKLTSISSEL
ncbi:LysR family transcriptional regulator [Mesorhizobium sp.]|uniref:LysR family transcriptional regulator n=2 Tax=Mesorhizobium sp. TaxID=1871066 RepID=UPI000FEA8E75|nr:LysR family transcriptional regulator [Mesorhizobium sp.]RWI16505.1 MAG: LysR family transcriptional regulator [Mesorhizobium sp.]RWN06267.1 MAG: LysR family transcriptional regulator [Mesorhizobium sp.]RWN08230.1 MAG: LysR family transcriptional regulator [Mesorhizobium sp.]TIQ97623.1 MAG: LysR family transcriptional regulator [Mesorhizobium sp.]